MSLTTVSKSTPLSLVVPAQPTPDGNIPLTSTDKSRLFLPFSCFLVFERPIHEPAETIRRSLSRALVHYYPIAGRVAVGVDDDAYLACTGEGVAFVPATANCTLKDVGFLHTPLAVIPLSDLAVQYSGRCGPSDPLLMMQVTEFTCGGYVVAVTWNHVIADAFGLALFLQALGEMAGELPSPSVVPVRDDDSLPEIPQVVAAIRKRPSTVSNHVDFVYSDFTVPRSFINRVKEEFRRRNHSNDDARPYCTTFEVVAAAIWQCRTRAINAEHSALAPLMFAANVRKLIGAKDGYYGNGVFSQLVEATTGEVANGEIVDLVRLIKDAKDRIPDDLTAGVVREMSDDLISAMCGYNVLALSSWGGLGLDGVDFGGGRPGRKGGAQCGAQGASLLPVPSMFHG
ncbi:hypothetical protein PR202_gb25830 [Eleusine coracana subsp. coracana]|uniref:Uncharacterized protein n=1 Tax=Eleusine coracana subsp. coracana TaxID=191504 RepID=A0AAV5FQ72_ELECO|nr:hypothetical protein QOZ80_4BG0354050 [Eleusine coracana subsp. coracana]GJN36893.1 hypothetical protein PR202_gb25794 [Eleusine coracana subsp. coracana]GJN36926.1 hypothetical protein PR202_gb25830 [Eleusine coracana subsp. coracana]